jgi:hypothetical protein
VKQYLAMNAPTAHLVISMANGALIPYHGCHSNTDDSDFGDSMHS